MDIANMKKEITRAECDDGTETVRTKPPFTSIYHQYVDRVYRYLYARLGCLQDAEDIAAQTFLAAFQAWPTFAGRSQVSTWLFSIARRRLADHYRGERATLPLDRAQDLPQPGMGLEEMVGNKIQFETIAKAMQLIAPERSEALGLRLFGGLSAAEIGGVMDKSEAAVKMLVFRGMQDLRERMGYPLEDVKQ
jgi:RNA polymerase sigma-70 factor, ECF subfamily